MSNTMTASSRFSNIDYDKYTSLNHKHEMPIPLACGVLSDYFDNSVLRKGIEDAIRLGTNRLTNVSTAIIGGSDDLNQYLKVDDLYHPAHINDINELYEQLSLDIDSSKYNKAIEEQFDLLLMQSELMAKVKEELISTPNLLAKDRAKECMYTLINEIEVLPLRVSPSVEEGVMLTYWNRETNMAMKIETYNDGDNPVGLINQNKNIILSKEIKDERDLKEMALIFSKKK